MLPRINPLFAEKIEEFNGAFTGHPDLQLFEVMEKVIEEINIEKVETLIQEENDSPTPDLDFEGQNELVDVVPPLNKIEHTIVERLVQCKEIDRLALVVRAIEHECACFPKEALKMSLSHQLRYNHNFRGLDEQECVKPKNWVHFRKPTLEAKQKSIKQAETIFSFDFLDEVPSDFPLNSWSFQLDLRKELVL